MRKLGLSLLVIAGMGGGYAIQNQMIPLAVQAAQSPAVEFTAEWKTEIDNFKYHNSEDTWYAKMQADRSSQRLDTLENDKIAVGQELIRLSNECDTLRTENETLKIQLNIMLKRLEKLDGKISEPIK